VRGGCALPRRSRARDAAPAARAGDWRPGRAFTFEIHDPKLRTITAAPFRDRVVHHAVMDVLEPVLERRMIDASLACRRGKGTHAALLHARRLVRRHAWFLKMDVARCFDSLRHDVVLSTLARAVKDARVNRRGSFRNDARNARSAYRNNAHPENRNDDLGFRPSAKASHPSPTAAATLRRTAAPRAGRPDPLPVPRHRPRPKRLRPPGGGRHRRSSRGAISFPGCEIAGPRLRLGPARALAASRARLSCASRLAALAPSDPALVRAARRARLRAGLERGARSRELVADLERDVVKW
jgi:hypothetical protein